MPLEHLGDQNAPIKITDIMAIPQKEEVYDPMADLYDEDVLNIFLGFIKGEEGLRDRHSIEFIKGEGLRGGYSILSTLFEVFPDKRNIIEKMFAQTVDELRYDIASRIKKVHQDETRFKLRRDIRSLSILLNGELPELPEDIIEEMGRDITKAIDKKNWHDFMVFVKELAVISPKSATEFLNRPGIFESCKSLLEDDLTEKSLTKDKVIVSLRILFPDQFSKSEATTLLSTNISKRRDEILANAVEIKAGRGIPSTDIIKYAYDLLDYKILTADHLKITRTGIVFSDGIAPSFDKETPPLPELKK